MLASIRHKGLRRFYEDGDARAIGANMRSRIEKVLTVLASARTSEDVDLPGYRLHRLTCHRAASGASELTQIGASHSDLRMVMRWTLT
jgi:plasmid maintenance system killer protein